MAGRLGGDGPALLGSALGTGGLVGVPGLVPGATVVVDRPGTGLVALTDPATAARAQLPPVADGYLTVVDAERLPAATLLPEQEMAGHRDAVLARTRLGAAAELLGIVDRLLDDAVAYARGRYQFGRPVTGYQSIQHLLAWAATERHQLVVLLDVAVAESARGAVDPALCGVVKAVAGRVLHAVAQAATQVTGAISFTWEHPLTRLHRRGLALDQLAGSSGDLVAAIGRQVRIEGAVPELVALPDVT
jgi:alkylation response protein AidB-like acyl-CoA dehydrogenase